MCMVKIKYILMAVNLFTVLKLVNQLRKLSYTFQKNEKE